MTNHNKYQLIVVLDNEIKITKQYSERAEILCAEFDDVNDALMINKSRNQPRSNNPHHVAAL